jgi:hypothetical protein
VIGARPPGQLGLLGVEVVATTTPPRFLTIWVSSRPTPPAAACTTATSQAATGYVLVAR